ncbi:DNA helicase-2/ATP-dependent DNA helicase PcrA [Chitinophaga dinghuensis]|uniref:DNA 3'-5' helicase n=1 Tax=Chitinophaga dinghuensis TaxID=1539050 RepID=A0A327W552_9BACT|nr:ATP-dependent DNA helicase [Chitinophaga dinghuensis]RAJ85627.1 DNA helicase-2/ATP-dependent DNA helicase PcrA [Chitinophaga dinghuensis]
MTRDPNQYHERFEEVYEKLNSRQREAVDNTEGPVMVIAGPGTGKTQILASRIGKILRDSDFMPQNILCLTYTDAGTVAMRKRLIDFIGPDAYRVNIHTFHSFCNEVIQDNLGLFDKTVLDPISDLEKIQLLKKLIDGFSKDNPLKRYRGDVYFDMRNLANLFSTMKREGWNVAYITERIQAYVKSLPERDEYICKRATAKFKKGDIRTDKIALEEEKMARLQAAVDQFTIFQRMMLDENRYDFDDMIIWVIRAFEENKNLLADYKERFQYILVDEYQDTSGTQNKLIQLLIKGEELPNIFVVGDDDQSIYRFQGANVENMELFASGFSATLRTIVLTENYRSVQNILDTAMTLIDNNGNSRLVNQLPGLSKNLVSSNDSLKHLHIPPVIHKYNTPKDEMADITLRCAQLLEDGVVAGKIAVIYRENKYGEELAEYFRMKGLPVYSKRNINLFNVPFARNVLNLLRYIAAELDTPYSGDGLLFEIMHYDFYDISPIEAAKVSIRVAEKGYDEREKASIRAFLQEWQQTRNLTLFSEAPDDELMKLGQLLEKWIKDAYNLTLQQLFGTIIGEGGILTYIMASNEKGWLMKVLQALFDFIKDETRRNPDLTLVELMETIDLMEANNIPIELVQVSGNDKGINLITAHGSKGLEFEYVFMSGTNSHIWEKKKANKSGFSMPDTVFETQATSTDEQELRRLFYVAITRAEKYLFISYPEFRQDGKPLEPSMFITEITEEHPLLTDKIEMSEDVMFEFEALHYHTHQSPEIPHVDHGFIDGLLSSFTMNVTALNNYLNCPLSFFYKSLVKVPTGRSESTEFGSAIHFAVEKLFVKMQANNSTFPPREEFLKDFKWSMLRNRECFTRESFERRMEYGLEILTNYYEKYVNSWNKIVSVERNIRNVIVNGVPIKGKVDKLEFDGNFINVVDYKTGDFERAIKDYRKFDRPNEKSPDGGDYWRQAVFYKLLLDNYRPKSWNVVSTEFDFIEPNKQKEYHKEKVVITPEDLTTVSQQIADTWSKIQQKDFYTGCGKPDCPWCNFVKDNKLYISLHTLEEEPEI